MIIGLSQRVIYHNGQAYDSTDQAWYRFLKGHQIITIKNDVDQDLSAIADQLDVLILTGGNDPTVRRITEIKLATQMLMRNKPTIGVCHGAFLLTEISGGVVSDIENHHGTEHVVVADNGIHTVNSYHVLKIEQAPDGATILAVDTDGNCEAWIDGAVAAVVWHPERMENYFLPSAIDKILQS